MSSQGRGGRGGAVGMGRGRRPPQQRIDTGDDLFDDWDTDLNLSEDPKALSSSGSRSSPAPVAADQKNAQRPKPKPKPAILEDDFNDDLWDFPAASPAQPSPIKQVQKSPSPVVVNADDKWEDDGWDKEW